MGAFMAGYVSRRHTISGVTYVQLQGRDNALWWIEGTSYADGQAYDTDEIAATRRSIKEIDRDNARLRGEAKDGAIGNATLAAAMKEGERERAEQLEFLMVLMELKAVAGSRK